MYSFPDLEPVDSSMSSSNCCFLTCIQISQESGQVVWYSHLFKNFPQFVVIHSVKGFSVVNKAEVDIFSGTLLLCQWSNRCWQFDHLLLGRKVMTNLDSILKSRYITLPTKVHLVKAVFSSSHVWMWELDHRENWALMIWWFWTVVLEGDNSWESLGLQGDPTSPS